MVGVSSETNAERGSLDHNGLNYLTCKLIVGMVDLTSSDRVCYRYVIDMSAADRFENES